MAFLVGGEQMSKSYIRFVAEEVSYETKGVIKREVIKEKAIIKPTSIMDLGMRHAEQIELLCKAQDAILKSQFVNLDDGQDKCKECGSHLRKNGYIKSEFFSVFTDHKVPIQRKICANKICGRTKRPTIYSLFGTTVHPDLAKTQCEIGAAHTYRESQHILNLVSSKTRKINNHDRVKRVVSSVGTSVEKHKDNEFKKTQADHLVIQVDGAHVKNKATDKRSFEVMTSIVYRPDSVIHDDKTDRGEIISKHCAASGLEDKQRTIKTQTLLACRKQGITEDTEITAICDGAGNCWSIIDAVEDQCYLVTRVLDWFHLSMKFENLSLPKVLKQKVIRIKWHLWRGQSDRALLRLSQLKAFFTSQKEKHKIAKLCTYIKNNKNYIVNYRERKKNKQVFTSNIAESNVESLVNNRCKGRQHMRWTRDGIHPLLQIRAAISSKEWLLNWKHYILPALSNI